MFSGTWHIIKQIEWFDKLKHKPYNCIIVEMEYLIFNGFNKPRFKCDVYGVTKEGKEYIIEIGCCSAYKIRKEYCQLHNAVFKQIPKPCTVFSYSDKNYSRAKISWRNRYMIISNKPWGYNTEDYPKEITDAQFFGLVSRGDING